MGGERTVRLGDACVKIGSGATPRGGKDSYRGGASSLIRSQNIYNEGFRREGLVYIDDEQSIELRNVEVRANDVLLNITGDSVARCCQVSGDVLPARVNQHVAIIRPQPKSLDAQFLRYVLVSSEYQAKLHSLASAGATRPALTKAMIENLEVPAPALREQQDIASILGALDDKIELNRRMNATLEAMARALFQSWFVDFDPVRAKRDGRTPAAIDADTASLFSDTFAESSLGPIPRDWTATTLAESCRAGGGTIQTGPFGTQLHASDYVSEGVPSIMPSDLRDNRIDTTSISRIREYDAERLASYRVRVGDVVYSRRGDVERRSLIRQGEDGWLCGTGCLRVRFGADGVNPFFGASLLGTSESRAWVVRHAVGATMPNLNTSILGQLPIIVPPAALQARFAEVVAPLDRLGTLALNESRTLAALRDSLLPKLLCGELRVSDINLPEIPDISDNMATMA